jgi:O-antigen ligase
MVMVVAVVALVMTHSRMGNGAFFAALLVTGAVLALRSRQLRKPALWLVASMVIIDVIVIGQWVGLDRVVERIRETPLAQAPAAGTEFGAGGAVAPVYGEESLVDRLQAPRLALQAVADRPLFGHGGGTFVTAFPPYKEAGMPWYWVDAHNDYVQVAVDTGVLGLTLWLLPGGLTAWRALRLMSDRHSATSRGLAVAAWMALCCMALHSMVDFNLHIPANALTLCVLLALAWSLPSPGHHRSREGSGAGHRHG